MLDFLSKYRSRGAFDGACPNYLKGILKCQSRKAVVDLLLSAQGVTFISQTIARGLITCDDLLKDLGMFEGERYVYEDKYTSAFHAGRNTAHVHTTLALIVSCQRVHVPKGHVCEVHVIGDCSFQGGGIAKIYKYNSDGTYNIARYANPN